MIAGQDINVAYAVLISLIGICVVMVELGLLALFVRIMSNVIGNMGSKKQEDVKQGTTKGATPVVQPVAVAAPVVVDSSDDEIAAIMTVVLEETGLKPEEIIFKSIKAL